MPPSNDTKTNRMETLEDDDLPSASPPPPEQPLTWPHLVGINLVSMGVDLCSSAGFSSLPPLMLKAGFTSGVMTSVMGVGPFLSLLLVPPLGRWSDRYWGCLGRRRPFILGLSILLLTSLLVIAYCHELGSFIMPGSKGILVTLGASVILLDFSTQALFNPCKAIVSDCHQEKGFTVFTFMLNLGSSIGYLLTSINWKETPIGRSLGGQEKSVFLLLFVVYLVFVVVSFLVAKERRFRSSGEPSLVDKRLRKLENGRLNFKAPGLNKMSTSSGRFNCVPIRKVISLKMYKTFASYVSSFFLIPRRLFRVFLTSLFAWMALHCHNDYYTDFVGQVIYNGKPDTEADSELYDQGVRMGSCGLLLQSITAVVHAGLVQDWLVARVGAQGAFLFGMSSFALCMLGSLVSSGIGSANLFSAASGFGVAAMSTITCNLVTAYNRDHSSEGRGLAEDMAVLDAASYVAQIIPFCFLGHLVRHYGSSCVYLAFAAFCAAVSCLGALFVVFPKRNLTPERRLLSSTIVLSL